jgi:hypothetical protein
MLSFIHLRSRIDELSARVEKRHEVDDAHQLMQECMELERAVQVHEDHLRHEVSQMEAAKALLHRLRARI